MTTHEPRPTGTTPPTAAGLPADLFALVAERTSNLVVVTDAQERIAWVNAAFTAVSGYTLDEVRGRTPGAVLQGPDTDPATRQRIRAALARGEAVSGVEILNYRKTGESYWLLLDIQPIRDAQGRVERFVAIQTDITERKRAALREAASDTRMRALMDNAPIGALEYELRDDTLVLVSANAAASRQLKIDLSPLLGRSITQAFPALADSDLPAAYRQTLRTGQPFRRPEQAYPVDGEILLFDVFGFQTGERRVAALFREATAERAAQRALAQSEAKFAALFESSPDVITVIRLDTHQLTDVNAAFEQFTGYSRAEAIGRRTVDLGLWVHPEERARLMELLATRDVVRNYEFSGARRHGPPRTCMLSSYRIRADGIDWLVTQTRDVSVERRLEAERAASEERLRRIFELIPVPMGITDFDSGRYLDVNRAWERVYGWTRDEARGRTTLDLGMWPDPAPRPALLDRLRQQGEIPSLKAQYRHRSGHLLDVDLSAALVASPDGPIAIWIGRDVTEERRLQAERADARARFEQMFDLAPEPMVVQTSEGALLDANRAWLQVFGWARDEVVGKTALDLGLWPDPKLRAPLLAQSVRDGGFTAVEVVQRRRDGELVDIELSARRIETPSGKIVLIVGRVITERKRAERQLRIKDAAIAGSLNAIAMAGVDGRLTYVNQALLSMWGFASDAELIGQPAEALWAQPEVAAAALHALHTDGAWSGELVGRRADGTPFTVIATASRICDERGVPIQLVATCIDITARKRAELTLRDSEQRLKAVVGNAPVILFVLDRDGVFRFSEGQGLAALGLQPGEVVGRTVDDVYGAFPDVLDSVRRALAGEMFRTVQTVGALSYDVQYSTQRDADGAIQGVIGVAVDISDRLRVERALAASRAQFKAFFELAPFPMTVNHADGTYLEVNRRFLESSGLSEGVVIGRTAAQVGVLSVDRMAEVLGRVRADGEVRDVEMQAAGADGAMHDLLLSCKAVEVDGVSLVLSATIDITERKRFEAELRESEKRFAAMFIESPVALAVTRVPGGEYLSVNDAFLRLFGLRREEVIGRNSLAISLYANPADRAQLIAAIRRERAIDRHRVVFRRASGEHRHCEVSGRVVRFGDEDVMLWATQDITEQREAQHALRNTVTRLQTVIMAAPVVLFAIDHGGRFTLSEGRGLEALGQSTGEVVGRHIDEVYAGAPELRAALQFALAGASESCRVRLGDRTFALFFRPLNAQEASYSGSIGVLVDVSDQARAEEALRELAGQLEQRVRERTAELARAGEELLRSEKLAALGRLVAGVAHELNTPIGNSVLVASSLADATHELQASLAAGLRRSTLEGYVAHAGNSAELLQRNLKRAVDLIASFKQVAVDQTSVQRREFDLAAVVHENVTALLPSIRSLPHVIEVEVADGVLMDSYPGPLGQVLTNLINNAMLHAFDGRSDGRVRIEAEPRGDAVALEVRDNGCGIAAVNLPRIFEPFFTTRLGKGGSGLGLNIVHTLVTGILGGTVEVMSEPGAGTVFTLTLPRMAPHLPGGDERGELLGTPGL